MSGVSPRFWLLALAGCWTGDIEPPAQPTRVAHQRPLIDPHGYFVSDLVSHRLETNAFDDQQAVDSPALPRPVVIRAARPTIIQYSGSASLFPISGSPVGVVAAPAPGQYVVQYCIDTNGRVTSAHVELRADEPRDLRIGPPPSDRSAFEKMRGWRFTPYFVNGKPVTACSFLDYTAL